MIRWNRNALVSVTVAAVALTVISLGLLQAQAVLKQRGGRPTQSVECLLGSEVLRTALVPGQDQGVRLDTAPPHALDDLIRANVGFEDLEFQPFDELGLVKTLRPSKDVLSRLAATASVSLLAKCPQFEASLRASGVGIGPRPASPTIAANGHFTEGLTSISAPVLSSDQKEALVVVESVSGLLAGGGGVEYWRRHQDGRWLRAGYAMLWIA